MKALVRFVVAFALTLLVHPVFATSLKDDIKYGCSNEVQINRAERAVRFVFAENQALTLRGAPAHRWLSLAEAKGLGGIFAESAEVCFKKEEGEAIHTVLRFRNGCLFINRLTITVLDWEAVKKWEQCGGYAKVGMPTKDSYNPSGGSRLVKPAPPSIRL